jgi:hypothetical protein
VNGVEQCRIQNKSEQYGRDCLTFWWKCWREECAVDSPRKIR